MAGRGRPCPIAGQTIICRSISVANFKGGSAKTTTSAHLAQYLALQGFRVLAIDLDPQASMSALFGVVPEAHVGPNETLYAAIRYDDQRRPLPEVIRETYFDGLDLVPGNLELMEFEHATPMAMRGWATRTSSTPASPARSTRSRTTTTSSSSTARRRWGF